MSTNQIFVIVVVAVAIMVAVVIGIVFAKRTKRSKQLQEKFGPEYDLMKEKAGDQRTAEQTLQEREDRISELDIRALNVNEKDHYLGEWKKIQVDFVDNPSTAVTEVDQLINEVMLARGFPVADFDQRAADLSVMYPNFVANYRTAHAVAQKNPNNEISTEELRQSMVQYHSMFNELLGINETKSSEAKENEKVIA